MDRIGPDLVTVLRPAGFDRHGDPIPPETPTDVPGCRFEDLSTLEQTGNRDTVTVDARVFMPAQSDIRATDRVRHLGATYKVDGEPLPRRLRAGNKHHIRVELRRDRG